jgi:hypothetical protein
VGCRTILRSPERSLSSLLFPQHFFISTSPEADRAGRVSGMRVFALVRRARNRSRGGNGSRPVRGWVMVAARKDLARVSRTLRPGAWPGHTSAMWSADKPSPYYLCLLNRGASAGGRDSGRGSRSAEEGGCQVVERIPTALVPRPRFTASRASLLRARDADSTDAESLFRTGDRDRRESRLSSPCNGGPESGLPGKRPGTKAMGGRSRNAGWDLCPVPRMGFGYEPDLVEAKRNCLMTRGNLMGDVPLTAPCPPGPGEQRAGHQGPAHFTRRGA